MIAVGSSIEELSQALPLTGLAPAAADGLDLLQSLNTALTDVKSDIDELDPASPALETALENADTDRFRAALSSRSATSRSPTTRAWSTTRSR